MAQVGRISGPLLEANLLRQGIANGTQANLSFKNTNNDTSLLKIDVANGRIGVDLEAPANELHVSQTTQTTNLIVPNLTNTPGYEITDSTFRVKLGNIYLDAAEAIVMANMENGTIRISDNIISTIESNADIDITPNGTGSVEVINNLEVFGNIDTLGNITFEGTITMGDSNEDTVTVEADINSDIIPDQNSLYNLGSQQNRWSTLYTNFVNGTSVEVNSYVLNGIELLTEHGGIMYVAQEGNDANSGDHIFDPLATISEALSRAEVSTNQPFTILVSPGEYQEALPLVVPENVSIIGADIRNVVVMPDTNSQSEDVFHVSDKTTIANLTVKDFYYDSVNNTGYAFRFAPDAIMNERSPYIQNVTVLTNETSNGAGDAGRGAWIDGDELNASTVEKTMLFHSCTFITPNADVINMTNDVRVEWLNSFTYYANRGLYAFNGVSGGAELRSIGSANVYGTYGAVADGADTLMYLIQHNFAYIGAGNSSTNDIDSVIQANEVVELNSGQIHYVSTDQVGNFRVGDNFFVNLETGDTSINIDTAEIDALTGLVINSPGGTTVIDSSYITTGDILIADNVISTNIGDLNLEGATGTINIPNNTNVSGNLNIVDNFSFGGTLNIAGNQPGRNTAADRLTFNVDFQQDFKPHVTLTHSLGEEVRPWSNTYLDRAEVDDITIDENYITTDISNANLDLRSTDKIYVPNNNVQVNNNLTVNGTASIAGTSVTGTIDYTGDRTQTGNLTIAGEIDTGNILIEDNFITTTNSSSDLELRANSTGKVLIPNNNVQINNNLTVSTDTDLQGTTITGTLTHTGDRVQSGGVGYEYDTASTNKTYIREYSTYSSGPVGGGGFGGIQYYLNTYRFYVEFWYENTKLYDTQYYQDTIQSSAIQGPLGIDYPNTWPTYDTDYVEGSYTYDKGTIQSDNPTEKRYQIRKDLTGTETYTLNGELTVDNVYVEDNFITTTSGNLTLGATGYILSQNRVEIAQDLTVNGATSLTNSNIGASTAITADILQTGNYTQTGNTTLTGNVTITQDLTVGDAAQFEEILIDNNYITTTTSNADLELRANGTGKILIPNNNNVNIVNNLSVDNIFNNNNVNVTLQTAFNEADVSDIDITQNYISTNNGNLDLLLRASGTGIINIEDAVLVDNDFTVGTLTSLRDSRTLYKYGPELVVNGTFDTNLNGWSQTGGGSANDVNGNLQINATGAARNVSQEITVEAGKTYIFKAQFRSVSNANAFYLRIFESGVGTLQEWNETSGLSNNQYVTYSFTPQTTAIDIIFRAVDTVVEWDNVSIIEDIGLVTENTPVDVDYLNLTQTGNTTITGDYTQTGNTDIDGDLTISNEIDAGNINIDANIISNFGEGLRPSNASNEAESLPGIVQAIISGSTADDFAGQTEKNLVNFLIDNNYIDVNQSGTQTTTDYISYLRYISNGSTGNAQEDSFIKSVFDEIIELELATPGYFNSLLFDGDYFNPNLELRANGTGKVLFSNANVNITNKLNVIGNTSLSNLTITNLTAPKLTVSDTTTFDDNYVSTSISNANLELRAYENKIVYIPSNNVTIDQNLTVNGTSNILDTSITGNIVQTGNRVQVGNINVTGDVTVSTSNIQNDLQFDDVLFDANIIESQDSNADLELEAHAGGVVNVIDTDVQINNNVITNGLNAANIQIDTSFTFEDFELSSNIQLFDNVITTSESNSNLELRSSEGGDIVLQGLFLNADTLRSVSDDISLNVTSVSFDSDGAVLIPVGTSLQDQQIDSGIRFNSTANLFEAYKNNNLITFGGVYSTDRQTTLLAHPTNNTITATVDNSVVGSIASTGLTIHGLTVDDIRIQDNNIRTTVSNSDLELRANGTGSLVLDDITLSEGTFSNSANSPLVLQNTLYGAVKFDGHSVRIPVGTDAERPANPPLGTTRWNTDNDILEVWDGTQFVTSAGTQQSISAAEMDDLILEYTLIFG